MFADELKLRAQAIRAKKSGCAADPPKATTVRPRRELAYDGDKCKYNITEKRHRFKRMVYVFALFLVVIIFFLVEATLTRDSRNYSWSPEKRQSCHGGEIAQE